MDIGLKIRRNPNFHYVRYDPLRPTEELTQPYGQASKQSAVHNYYHLASAGLVEDHG